MLKYFLLFFSFVLFSCIGPNPHDNLIIGQWKNVSWTIDNSDQKVNKKMDFVFNDDMSYTIDYGSIKENGIYSIDGDRLYTTEEGQSRKYVKIINMSIDSFVFKMNRAGRMETVILVK